MNDCTPNGYVRNVQDYNDKQRQRGRKYVSTCTETKYSPITDFVEPILMRRA